MSSTLRIQKVLTEDGKIWLDHLPYRAGQSVEITLCESSTIYSPPIDLQNKILEYIDPTEPVAADEWEVTR